MLSWYLHSWETRWAVPVHIVGELLNLNLSWLRLLLLLGLAPFPLFSLLLAIECGGNSCGSSFSCSPRHLIVPGDRRLVQQMDFLTIESKSLNTTREVRGWCIRLSSCSVTGIREVVDRSCDVSLVSWIRKVRFGKVVKDFFIVTTERRYGPHRTSRASGCSGCWTSC